MKADVFEILEMLGANDYRDVEVSLLLYGIRKLADLARTLASSPELLLLDEPAAGLNTAEKEHFASVLIQLFDQHSMALIMIEHDIKTVEMICPEHVKVMNAGRKIADGTFEDVIVNEDVIAAHIGD